MKKYAIGVDIGGTKIAIGVVNELGHVIDSVSIPTNVMIPPENVIHDINQQIKNILIENKLKEDEVIGIGVGAPGPLDSKAGMITCPPNLPLWRDLPIKKLIENAFSIPVLIENDANAAALAEKWIGDGQACDHFIYMTISTGIGSGIITEGKLLRGKKGNAGDIGHMVVNPTYGVCTCGQEGCLEWIASGTAIARIGSEIMEEKKTTEEIFKLYNEGQDKIVPYINDVFKSIGQATVTLINTFDTEKIIIGGGVSQIGDTLIKPIQTYINHFALNPEGRKVKVVQSHLGSNNGVIGAAALWLNQ
ncbi:MAG TPA: ROK family protein [Pseudogracilibacillus sp.]|nr:ROK family protein [Pseudogracilibacillus sp.]